MTRHSAVLLSCVGMLCLSATLSHKSRAAAAPEILSQQLTSPTASKKVEAVLWTRRPDRYTLQVVFPNIGRLLAIGDSLKTPEVALWLLRSDGTTVVATRQVVPEQKNGARPTEIVYTVPLSTGEEAVAAAFRIEDNYYIEPLRPLKGK